MSGLRISIVLATAVATLSAGQLAAQQAGGSNAQNNPAVTANQPASGPAAPGVSPSRRDEPGSSSSTAETPPVAGANSFTEAQARDRIAKSGFNSVKDLQKDGQGIWRGKAEKGGREVSVALDYRGNVVQQ